MADERTISSYTAHARRIASELEGFRDRWKPLRDKLELTDEQKRSIEEVDSAIIKAFESLSQP